MWPVLSFCVCLKSVMFNHAGKVQSHLYSLCEPLQMTLRVLETAHIQLEFATSHTWVTGITEPTHIFTHL